MEHVSGYQPACDAGLCGQVSWLALGGVVNKLDSSCSWPMLSETELALQLQAAPAARGRKRKAWEHLEQVQICHDDTLCPCAAGYVRSMSCKMPDILL